MIVGLRGGEPERDVDALEGADGLGEDELEKRADHVHGRAAGQEPDERLDVTPPVAAERIVQWLLYPPLQTREVLARDRTAVARHDVLLGQRPKQRSNGHRPSRRSSVAEPSRRRRLCRAANCRTPRTTGASRARPSSSARPRQRRWPPSSPTTPKTMFARASWRQWTSAKAPAASGVRSRRSLTARQETDRRHSNPP